MWNPLCMQLGEEPASMTAAEKARRQAIEEGDEGRLLEANSELIAAMLDCQYGNVALNQETAEVTIQVLNFLIFFGMPPALQGSPWQSRCM